MRQHYTPIFRKVLTSSLWVFDPATRCVWLWLELSADPEGYVTADLRGVAQGANVSLSQARQALTLLASIDADADADAPHQGRLIEKVPGGYRVLDFEEQRELAREESKKAANRRYMRRVRAEARGESFTSTEAANDSDVDAGGETTINSPPTRTKTRTRTKTDPSEAEGSSPLPPTRFEPRAAEAGEPPVTVLATSRVIFAVPADWQPSPELRQEAAIEGVLKLDEHVQRLRSGPIGGTRGVFERDLDGYIRSMFGKWRAWEETDRAKAAAAAKAPAARGFQKAPALEAKSKHKRVAAKYQIDLDAILRDAEEKRFPETLGYERALELVEKELARQVQAKIDAGLFPPVRSSRATEAA